MVAYNDQHPADLQSLSLSNARHAGSREEETIIPKHTIHSFGQTAGMSRRNRSSFGEERKRGGRKGGDEVREEWHNEKE